MVLAKVPVVIPLHPQLSPIHGSWWWPPAHCSQLRAGIRGRLQAPGPRLGLDCGDISGCGLVVPPIVAAVAPIEGWGEGIGMGAES